MHNVESPLPTTTPTTARARVRLRPENPAPAEGRLSPDPSEDFMRHPFASALRRATLTLTLLCAGLATLPAAEAANGPSDNRQQAAAMTEQLLQLQRRLDRAASAERAPLLQQLQQQAAERQNLLAELAGSDPAAALRASLPEAQQGKLAREVLDKVERPQQIEGTLEVIYEDARDGKHRLRHFVTTPFGERFELSFGRNAPHQGNGRKVRLDGVLFGQKQNGSDGVLALEDGASNVVWLDNAGTSTTLDVTPSVQYSLGEQKTLMILVNFSDKPDQPWTPSQAQDMFNTLDSYIRENSAGRTWLTGGVAGWYTIALSSTVCDPYTLRNQAQGAAMQAGYNMANYDRLIYVFPQNGCGFAGSGSVGGKPTDAFINAEFNLHNLAHEFGHNLGLDHAHALDCGATTLGSTCDSIVYGDTLDVLGYYAGEGHYNAFNKERLGWLKSSEILTVGSSGSYTVVPYADLASSGVRVLKVAKPNDPSSWYYVNFHQPVGFEAQLLDGSTVNAANVTGGVTVIQANSSNSYSELLDMTPGSGGLVSDWYDPALDQGLSFTDTTAGVTLTTTWADSQKAQVDVQFSGSASCVQNAPSVQIGAPVTQWGNAGQTLSYTVQLTNNDSSACSGRSFNLQNSLPSGWSARFASASLSPAPGQSASTSLAVTSASAAAAAYYDLSVSTTQAPANTATLTYVVQAGTTNHPPVAQNDQASLTSLAPLTIAVLANDSDPDGDKLSVVAVTQGAKGTVRINSDGTLTYTPGKSFKSSDQFGYTISDGQTTASATVSVSLATTTTSTSGGKGKP